MLNDTMTVEEWDTTFIPVKNHLDENASWDGVMFETYGDEYQHIRFTDVHHVWTYIDGDGGTYLVNGHAWVNRIGYFVTEKEWNDGDHYCINVGIDDFDCGRCEATYEDEEAQAERNLSPDQDWCSACKTEGDE